VLSQLLYLISFRINTINDFVLGGAVLFSQSVYKFWSAVPTGRTWNLLLVSRYILHVQTDADVKFLYYMTY